MIQMYVWLLQNMEIDKKAESISIGRLDEFRSKTYSPVSHLQNMENLLYYHTRPEMRPVYRGCGIQELNRKMKPEPVRQRDLDTGI